MSQRASSSGLYGPLWYTTFAGGSGITEVVASGTVVGTFSIVDDWFRKRGGKSYVGVMHDEDEI